MSRKVNLSIERVYARAIVNRRFPSLAKAAQLLFVDGDTKFYYRIIALFYHLWYRESAKCDAVLQCGKERIRTESAEQQNGRGK